MKTNAVTNKDIFILGLMMFALFLGAGNLIFPPAMGQAAGTNVSFATIGFLVTGVGLPVLAIIAIAKSGGDLQKISERVGPLFAIIFPLAVYLAIGPLFGIPRTGSVAYEIGLTPYLKQESTLSLLLFTCIFFSISYWLSLNPSKLVGRIGKIITPIIVLILLVLTVTGVFQPLGSSNSPLTEYQNLAFFKGFHEGYYTMDAIAALVFGIIIIMRLKEHGISSYNDLMKITIQVGVIAGLGLSFVYISLSFLGATSVDSIGYLDNGGAILAGVSQELLGYTGLILLSLIITLACITTSVGLITAFGEYMRRVMPNIPYKVTTGIIAFFSFSMANMGLSQLIQFSLPMLLMIYPVAIILILLTLAKDLFQENMGVFRGAVIGGAIISIPDGLSVTNLFGETFTPFLSLFPFHDIGIAWILPAIIGGIVGGIIIKYKNNTLVK
ncbi:MULTISPECIES: branched-chain amino acid transport system II carrier protein [Bacillaceae]|uniref:Branched-chain amino acid transport system carrier protein n=1 Tax=Evansella alkalicola TaxID=745819 RepID=A0ABS6JSR0_9BACI|nr:MULTISPECIES: branched-chain amino acid transport system II carrier protein [Bacillaceae]MBU9721111.1 branched-chain amino acid transport system II carrier protein [Bacillus alkalicola]